MEDINLYQLQDAFMQRPEVHDTRIIGGLRRPFDDTLLVEFNPDTDSEGTHGLVLALSASDPYPTVLMGEIYESIDDYVPGAATGICMCGHHDFADDDEYEAGVEDLIDQCVDGGWMQNMKEEKEK